MSGNPQSLIKSTETRIMLSPATEVLDTANRGIALGQLLK